MSDIVALQHKIIPKWASFDEAVYYVMEYDEHNYNNMMKSIALDELGYVMESAEEQPDNSSKIKKMKDAVVKWLNSAFESLKALFNKALQAIKEKVRSVKGRITGKAIKAAEAKLDKLKDKEYGFTYTYTELDKAVKSSSDSASVWKLVDDIINAKNGGNLDAELEKAKSAFLRSLKLGEDAKEVTIRNAYMNYLRSGNPDKAVKVIINKGYLQKNFSKMAESINGYDTAADFVKKAINRDKKAVNEMIGDLKKDKKSNSTTYSVYIPYLKFAYRMVSNVETSTISVLRERLYKDLAIVMRLVTMATPKSADDDEDLKVKAVGESGFMESSSYQSEVASLFDWSF